MQTLTDSIVNRLRGIPKGGDVPRPSAKSLTKLRKIMGEFERCCVQLPKILIDADGIHMIWCSTTREIQLVIDPNGDVSFESALKRLDKSGDIVAIMKSDGPVEGPRGVDRMLAWFYIDQSAQA